jgi:hypothetical protein
VTTDNTNSSTTALAGAIYSEYTSRLFNDCFVSDAQTAEVLNSEMVKKYGRLFLQVKAKDRLQHDDFIFNYLYDGSPPVPEFVKQLEAVLNRKRFLPPSVCGSFDLCLILH